MQVERAEWSDRARRGLGMDGAPAKVVFRAVSASPLPPISQHSMGLKTSTYHLELATRVTIVAMAEQLTMARSVDLHGMATLILKKEHYTGTSNTNGSAAFRQTHNLHSALMIG